MPKVPNHSQAQIPEGKVRGYLLNFSHISGRGKAIFFMSFGFDPEQWTILRDALFEHIQDHDLVTEEITPFGIRYTVEGMVITPDQRNPEIRTVWMIETGSDDPVLVSAYPLKKRKING